MSRCLALIIITVSVGGGFTGCTITLPQLFGSGALNPAAFLMIGTFFFLYGFVMVSGLLFAQNQRRRLPLVIAFALQVPWISSPLVTYRFTAGFQATLGLVGGRFAGALGLGSGWQFTLFREMPWGIGLNLFAILVLVLLARTLSSCKAVPSPMTP